jgi:hypothetical protein
VRHNIRLDRARLEKVPSAAPWHHCCASAKSRALGEAIVPTTIDLSAQKVGPRHSLDQFFRRIGPHGVFKRGKDLKDLIAVSALKRMQVDVPSPSWLNADEHRRSFAVRTARGAQLRRRTQAQTVRVKTGTLSHRRMPMSGGDEITYAPLRYQTRVNSRVRGAKR